MNGYGWVRHDRGTIIDYLLAKGYKAGDARCLHGAAVDHPWTLGSTPFVPEFDEAARIWYRRVPQLVYTPAAGQHPHWSSILSHCFGDLDGRLGEWGAKHNISTGHDYGLLWIANLIRHPAGRLPYLFLWGEQNGGKSILHEAIASLMDRGVASADRALTAEHNGELVGAVLAFIEEKNIAEHPGAYAKLKDLVTSPSLWVRKMRTDAYPVVNHLHFVQVSNERDACPIGFGDTRVIALHVGPLAREIPKPALMQRLSEEGPAFLHSLLNVTLPEPDGRLRLPVFTTASKERIVADSVPGLAQAIADLGEFAGTAKELGEAIGRSVGSRAAVRNCARRNDVYFRQQGISIELPSERKKQGAIIVIHRV